jgi:hypothetical protein
MDVSFVWGNMAWNAGLVAIAGVLIKRWMDRIEDTQSESRKERIEGMEKLGDHMEGISNQMRIANGRTSTIEGEVKTIKAVCRERHNITV